jgi:hypothetical protein
MAFRWPMRGGRLFVLLLALWGFIAPGTIARADTTNYLVNGSFAVDGGGWEGVDGGNNCAGGEPSMAPWGPDGLTFSHEYNSVYQEVTVLNPGDVTLTFTGQLGEAGGYYEATLTDDDESVAAQQLTNVSPEQSILTVTTEVENEVVIVTFGGVDEAWWAGCYGPIIKDASLIGESIPEETTTTTTQPPEEYSPPSDGLDYWTYSAGGGQPELPPTGQLITTGHISGLDYDWGGGEVLDSGQGDSVLVKFEGWLSPPESKIYYLCAYTDDGFKLYLDDELVINDWVDRGPSCGNTADVDFSNGEAKRLTGFYYENGGGAVAKLFYSTDAGSWATVPDSWYSDSGSTPATTTTTTTIPSSLGAPTDVVVTQTEEGIVIDWEASTEDIGISPERYAVSWSVNGSGWGVSTGNVGDENALNTQITLSLQQFQLTGGLDVEYTFTVRSDNDTQGIYSVATTGVSFYVSAPVPETTTTEVPQTTTTTVPPVTTIPPTTIDSGNDGGGADDTTPSNEEAPVDGTTPSSTPENEIPESTPGGETEETPTETPVEPTPEEPVAEEPIPEEPTPVEPAPEEPTPEEPVAEESISIEELESMDPEELVTAVDMAIEEGLSAEDATLLATSAVVLASLDGNQASEVFSSLEINGLSDDEIEEIVDAVQDAPEEVRTAFEEEINIFGSGGAMDAYVPLGSKISVGERRVVIAATGVLLAGIPMPVSAPAPSQPSNNASTGEANESSGKKRKVR